MKKQVTSTSQAVIILKIKATFPEDPKTAAAIFTAESGLNPYSQGWNCRYGGKSQSCKPEDRAQAWSVDCGVAQINIPGTNTCPEYAYDVSWNLSRARQKYDSSRWNPWVVYKTGAYKSKLSLYSYL